MPNLAHVLRDALKCVFHDIMPVYFRRSCLQYRAHSEILDYITVSASEDTKASVHINQSFEYVYRSRKMCKLQHGWIMCELIIKD